MLVEYRILNYNRRKLSETGKTNKLDARLVRTSTGNACCDTVTVVFYKEDGTPYIDKWDGKPREYTYKAHYDETGTFVRFGLTKVYVADLIKEKEEVKQ